ncbi:MAG: DNA double-strand break repair nuclease NurA [Promethearchaeota archaeon]
MSETLNETAARKKEEISKKVNGLEENIPNIKPYWNQMEIKEGQEFKTIAGVDGSSNYREFLSIVLYALGAECIIQNGKMSSIIRKNDIDILQPYRYTRDRIRFYMTIFELKAGLKALKNDKIDYILFDGSILGNIIRPVPFGINLESNIRQKLIREYVPKLQNRIKGGEIEISSLHFQKSLKNDFGNDAVKPFVYLEYLENLITIKSLLKYKEKIIGISKTSKQDDYFKLNIPDIAIFNLFNKYTGYSKPISKEITVLVKREFPILDRFFRQQRFKIFYARLKDRNNVFKFEIPRIITNNEIKTVLSDIKKYCVNGYPFQLIKAHKDIIIRHRDMDLLIKQFGLTERTGREML